MDNAGNFPGQSRARFWFVFALFVVLMVLAHGGAEVKAALDARAPADMPRHTVTYYRVIFTIWIIIILLTAALSFHIFARAGAANDYWIAFWTFAYLAFLTHLYWTIAGTFHFDWTEIFHSQEGVASDPERVVDHPGPDLFLAAWWGLDVVLAWFVPDRKLVRVQRGVVHLLAFTMFFAAFVLASKASTVAHCLGIAMGLAVTACFVIHRRGNRERAS